VRAEVCQGARMHSDSDRVRQAIEASPDPTALEPATAWPAARPPFDRNDTFARG